MIDLRPHAAHSNVLSLVLSIFVSCVMFCVTSSLTWFCLVINILRLLNNIEDR